MATQAEKERVALEKARQEADSGFMMQSRSFSFGGNNTNSNKKEKWTPCENGLVSSDKPSKPQTKFNKCLSGQGYGYEVIRCSNWKKSGEMESATSESGKACMLACNDIFNDQMDLPMWEFKCAN